MGFIPDWAAAVVVVAVIGAVLALIVGEVMSSWREKRRKGDPPSPD